MKYVRIFCGLAAVGLAASLVPAIAQDMVKGYVTGTSGTVVKNSAGDCWRSQFDESSSKLPECGYAEPAPAPAPALAPGAALEVVTTPTAATITGTMMERITIAAAMLFSFDSAELSGDAKAVIDERIQALRGQAKLTSTMRIEGHTDSTGPEDYNRQLSQRRAQSVADYIVSRSYNVKASDIEVIGMGESDPVASNASPEGRAENRRVVILAEGEISN
jgi:OmpA-OmpF porin, OOP family